MNKHPKKMTSDELLVKLKKDNVNTNAATTVGGEKSLPAIECPKKITTVVKYIVVGFNSLVLLFEV